MAEQTGQQRLFEQMMQRWEWLLALPVQTAAAREGYAGEARTVLQDQATDASTAAAMVEESGDYDQAEALTAYAQALRTAAPRVGPAAPSWSPVAAGLRGSLEADQMRTLQRDPRIAEVASVSAESALSVWSPDKLPEHTKIRGTGYTRDLAQFRQRAEIARVEGRPLYGNQMRGVREAVSEVSTERQLRERDAVIVRTKLAMAEMMADPAAAEFEDMEELSDQLNQWNDLGIAPGDTQPAQATTPADRSTTSSEVDVETLSLPEQYPETGPTLI